MNNRCRLQSIALAILLFETGIFYAKSQEQEPVVVEPILTEVRKVGETASLNCTVAFVDSTVWVSWLRVQVGGDLQISENELIQTINRIDENNGLAKYEVQVIPPLENEDVETEKNFYNFVLTINNLEQVDSGTYRCSTFQSGVPVSYRDGSLIVTGPPSISPSQSPWILADVGSTVSLDCSAEGVPAPQVTWHRVDGLPLRGGQLREVGASMNLTNVQLSDIATYRCVAKNSMGTAYYDHRLQLRHAPLVKLGRSHLPAKQQLAADNSIECLVQGDPEPEVNWYRNDASIPIYNNEIYAISKYDHCGVSDLPLNTKIFTLRLLKMANYNGKANFSCVAFNKFGTTRVTIQLTGA